MIASINGWEWVILAVIVLVVVGPERLPDYTRQLGRIIREVRRIAAGAQDRVKEELGPELEELRQFDPRAYDPRRIIREALEDDVAAPGAPAPVTPAPVTPAPGTTGIPAGPGGVGGAKAAGGAEAQLAFDDEAT